jgi:hypothetical protein
MATKIYYTGFITLMDGTQLYLTPLKIKYLRDFMDAFQEMQESEEGSKLDSLIGCILLCMRQYCPRITTVEELEDSIDIQSMYIILEIASGVKTGFFDTGDDVEEEGGGESSGQDWSDLDLAKLESEAFMLGIWKDYEELESSLSLQELTAIIEQKRETDYQDKKFLAALQGVDLDEQNGKKEQDPWEAMKARVFSGGQTSDSNDVLALQGHNAAKAGFGIGAGLSYEKWD